VPRSSRLPLLFDVPCYAHQLQFHSFPTRRSSDLATKSKGDFPRRRDRNWDSAISPVSSRPSRPSTYSYCKSGKRTRSKRLPARTDRKSTRLNSSHVKSSYAVFCLKEQEILQQRDH